MIAHLAGDNHCNIKWRTNGFYEYYAQSIAFSIIMSQRCEMPYNKAINKMVLGIPVHLGVQRSI